MPKQLVIDLSDEQVLALSDYTKYSSVVDPKETFEEFMRGLILTEYLNPMIASQIRTDEVKKIEAVIDQKIDDTIYKKPEPLELKPESK